MGGDPAEDRLAREKIALTPASGFALVGMDPFAVAGDRLYLVEHFEAYRDALDAKKNRGNPDEYLVLYRGASGEFLFR